MPRTPTEPKRYFREASRRSKSLVRTNAYEIIDDLTEEAANLIGRHESLGELLGILESNLPNRVSL